MLTVAVQAGGESRRMGRDKALISFLGQPLIQRIVTRLSPMADEMIITTNHPDTLGFLGLPLFSDDLPAHGALGGLYTALINARHPFVAVAACDMPFASPALFALQADILRAEPVDIVIPLITGGYEPLHAVYRRETCLPAVKWALDNDQWKLISWFSRVKVRTLSSDECQLYDPLGLAFMNVNTPQELAEAEEIARQGY
jgi:molybdenum cofactor guanylyltransferase